MSSKKFHWHGGDMKPENNIHNSSTSPKVRAAIELYCALLIIHFKKKVYTD